MPITVLKEAALSLPTSAIAELIACKNFQVCQQQFSYNHIYKPFIHLLLTTAVSQIFGVIFVSCGIEIVSACIVDSDK